MYVTLIDQDGRSFDSFCVDWLKKAPHSLEKITIVWVESILVFNSARPDFYEGVFDTGYSALVERCCTLHGEVLRY